MNWKKDEKILKIPTIINAVSVIKAESCIFENKLVELFSEVSNMICINLANWNNDNTSKTAVVVEIKTLKITCFLVLVEQFKKIEKYGFK